MRLPPARLTSGIDVRSHIGNEGRTGLVVLNVSSSHFDPKRPSSYERHLRRGRRCGEPSSNTSRPKSVIRRGEDAVLGRVFASERGGAIDAKSQSIPAQGAHRNLLTTASPLGGEASAGGFARSDDPASFSRRILQCSLHRAVGRLHETPTACLPVHSKRIVQRCRRHRACDK
jgi:hypothetical protein